MNSFEQAAPLYPRPEGTSDTYPLGPSRQDPHYGHGWVQPWSDGVLRASKQPGSLVVMEDHFFREDRNGQYIPSTAHMFEGWGLAARECIRTGMPRDPRLIARAGIGIVRALRSPKGKVAAVAAEMALIFGTPGSPDEVLLFAGGAGMIAIGGTMAVVKRREQLNGR